MKYIIINDFDFFKNKINIKNFSEVKNEKDRCDAVFGTNKKKILDEFYKDPGRRDSILPNSWLLRDGGTIFILCKIETNILHDKDESFVEKLLELYDKKSFYIEIRSYNSPQINNKLESYLFAYNKKLEYQENTLPDKITDIKDKSIVELLCEKIEEIL